MENKSCSRVVGVVVRSKEEEIGNFVQKLKPCVEKTLLESDFLDEKNGSCYRLDPVMPPYDYVRGLNTI